MKNLTKLLAVAMVVFSFQACTEVLEDVEPTTAITPEVAFQDPGSVRAFRTQLYSRLQGFDFTTRYMLGPEALADQSYNRTGSSRFNGYSTNQFRSGMADGSYQDVYNIVQDANVVIEAIPDGVIPAEEKEQYRGEAFFFRAFAMHYLVKAHGYEPGQAPASGEGAGWDLGIIIRTNPTLGLTDADNRPRSTVTEVYQQIRDDLNQAITILGNGQEASRNYVQQATAYALLARVELYARNYPAAETAAAAAIANTSASLTTGADVATMFDEVAFGTHPEAIFEIEINPNTESQGINSSLNAYTSDQWIAQIPTNSLLTLYDKANDQRWNWYQPCFNTQNGAPQSGCTNDAGGGDTGLMIIKWNGDKGLFTDDVPHFRIAEMLLIQAEARLNGAPGDPLVPFNQLITSRGLTAVGAVTLDDILDERRRELAFEGHRFFDLKRLQRPINKDAQVSGQALTIPYTDIRFLDDIDADDLDDNPELVQNPGY